MDLAIYVFICVHVQTHTHTNKTKYPNTFNTEVIHTLHPFHLQQKNCI